MLLVKPLTRYFDFTGRASRKEFWLFSLAILAGWAVLLTLDTYLGWAYEASGPLSLAFHYATLIPWLAVSARRLHDSDRSGVWVFIWVLPLIIMTDILLSHPSLYAEMGVVDLAPPAPSPPWARPVLYGGLAWVVIGFGWFLLLMCFKGTAGKNRFGDVDK
ncbi:MAG: DUF805 domain-containing protein [Proteobacteria bacterium]|nr:DUF805 domain-containing protein [Pseudomonadota bacterium]